MKKLLASTLLTFALLALTAGPAFAQEVTPTPTPTPTTTITGTVQSVALTTDATGAVTGVLVTFTDSTGATQTATLTLADATAQGLVTTDAAGVTTVNDNVVGLPVTIPAPTTTGGDQHPVGSALADFFGELLGVDYKTIMDYHDEGAGFGVIAQALWMSTKSDGTISFDDIMNAKLNNDYTGITLADGSHPTNWGLFKKAILQGEQNNSLGDVMSGKADTGDQSTNTNAVNQDNGNKGHGHGGQGHGGHGHGKP